ncbi:MAG: rhodanese-like domain-containing protein [Hyphomicrobiaceae bacterium]
MTATSISKAIAVAVAIAIWSPVSMAQSTGTPLPSAKQTKLGKYATASEVPALLATERSKTVFIDTRTRGELQFVGVPSGIDAHVPYAEMNEFGEWDAKAGRYKVDLNSSFGSEVERVLQRKGLGKSDRVLLICRSGDRSAKAADLLAKLGYTNVFSITDGFEGDLSKDGRRTINGWKNAGLPWSYKLDPAQAYRPQR